MKNFCIVITGLPSSGKSTIGKVIANELRLPYLDKDDYLETLFEDKGIGDLKWRQQLSRESDELFKRDAQKHKAAVLVSHWRPKGSNSTSGTPVEWIEKTYAHIIELYCRCPVDEVAKRFMSRSRHPGHQDGMKSKKEILEWLRIYRKHLPLSLGILETLDTSSGGNMQQTIYRLSGHIQADA